MILGNHEEDVVTMNMDAFVRSFRKRVSRDTLFKYQSCLCLFKSAEIFLFDYGEPTSRCQTAPIFFSNQLDDRFQC